MNKLLIRESEYINGLPLTNIQKVKLYQMLYRGMTHDSSTYFLLHGSTAITKSGKCILFGVFMFLIWCEPPKEKK